MKTFSDFFDPKCGQ